MEAKAVDRGASGHPSDALAPPSSKQPHHSRPESIASELHQLNQTIRDINRTPAGQRLNASMFNASVGMSSMGGSRMVAPAPASPNRGLGASAGMSFGMSGMGLNQSQSHSYVVPPSHNSRAVLAALRALQAKIQSLKHENEELAREHKRTADEMTALESRLTAKHLQETLKAREEHALAVQQLQLDKDAEVRRAHEECEQTRASLQAEVRKLRSDLQEAQRDVQTHRRSEEELRGRMHAMEKKLLQYEASAESFEAERSELQRRLTDLHQTMSAEMSHGAARNAELESNYSELQKVSRDTAGELERVVATITEDNEALRREKAKLTEFAQSVLDANEELRDFIAEDAGGSALDRLARPKSTKRPMSSRRRQSSKSRSSRPRASGSSKKKKKKKTKSSYGFPLPFTVGKANAQSCSVPVNIQQILAKYPLYGGHAGAKITTVVNADKHFAEVKVEDDAVDSSRTGDGDSRHGAVAGLGASSKPEDEEEDEDEDEEQEEEEKEEKKKERKALPRAVEPALLSVPRRTRLARKRAKKKGAGKVNVPLEVVIHRRNSATGKKKKMSGSKKASSSSSRLGKSGAGSSSTRRAPKSSARKASSRRTASTLADSSFQQAAIGAEAENSLAEVIEAIEADLGRLNVEYTRALRHETVKVEDLEDLRSQMEEKAKQLEQLKKHNASVRKLRNAHTPNRSLRSPDGRDMYKKKVMSLRLLSEWKKLFDDNT